MTIPFTPLSTDQGLTLAREYMGFTSELSFRLLQEIPGAAGVYVADLGALVIGTELTFTPADEVSDERTKQRSPETPVVRHLSGRANAYCLNASGNGAIVLIRDQESRPKWNTAIKTSRKHKERFDQGKLFTCAVADDEPVPNGKCVLIWRFKVIDPAGMVGWYDPAQLFRTALQVITSTLFGRHADYRLMEALSPGKFGYFDYTGLAQPAVTGPLTPSGPRNEIWLDYIGDVGDGWNSTYALAYLLAQPTLKIRNPSDATEPVCDTQRGSVLVFGGDQVYPTANRAAYQRRLLQPYETALNSTDPPHPHAYAIPGNHDWYDSLVSFTRLFCQKRWFAGWQTNQQRSYFALLLPGRWWLLGTDVQLDSDIDVRQVDYFKEVANHMQPGDQVVICTAEPHWVYAKLYGRDDANFNENNLAFLEKKVIGDRARVVAFIAGDQHHYRRYEGADGTQKITAGGGGAFMHPTHSEEVDELDGGFRLQPHSYPNKEVSKRLGLRNLKFPLLNPQFGILTALAYVLTAWTVMADVGSYGLSDIIQAIKTTLSTAIKSPAAVFWISAIFIGFLTFTDTHSKRYRRIAGPVHAMVHLFAAFFIGWAAAYLSVSVFEYKTGERDYFSFMSVGQLLFSAVFILVLGALIGSAIMGLYLLISINVFGRHANEAFSSLAIEDWKNFIRIRIKADGELTIYPVGIPAVPRKWRKRNLTVAGSEFEPVDVDITDAQLIEPPIRIRKASPNAPIPVDQAPAPTGS